MILTELEALVETRRQAVKDADDRLARAKELLREAEHAVWRAKPACDSFKWIGQSFKHCDDCGKPFWEHTHEERWVKGTGVVAIRITPESAAACKAKWDTP